MDIEAFFEGMPFAQLLGIELTNVADGYAEGRIGMREELSWNQDRIVAHGGVTYTLADTVGGAALVSLVDQPVPTIDMRIDYLNAGTGDLHAEADVLRCGSDVGVVAVDVYAEGASEREGDRRKSISEGDREDGSHLATARGVYKTG